MSVLKLSKIDITKNNDADNKIKLKKSQLSYDSAMVSGWETQNKDSMNTLNNYYTKLNNNEWLSADDIKTYRSALDSYISTSNRLRGLSKAIGDGYSEEDEKSWTDSINLMNSTYDSVSKLHSAFKSAESYDQWYKKESFIDAYIKDAEKATTEFEYDNSWIKEADRRIEEDTILNSEDFDIYSQKGLSIENPSVWDAQKGLNITNPFTKEVWRPSAEKINNIATFARDIHVQGTEWYKYSHMTDDEVAIYSYYLGKGDKDSADRYLSSLEDTLNQRWGGQIAENFQSANLEWIMAINTGLDQWASGVRNIENFVLGTEADPITPIQYAGSQIREDIDSDFWKGAWDLGVTLSNQLPSILVGTLTGNIGGLATMGVSVAGNSYAEMRNLGYDEWQSRGYATLVTAAELGLQSVLGGISSLGGSKSLSKMAINAVDGIDNAIGRIAAKWGIQMLSEGAEEAAQSVLEPIFKAIVTNGEEWDGIDWGEVAYSGLLGALSAGVLEPVGIIAEDVATTKAGQAVQNVGAIDRLKSVGSTFSADSVAYKLAGKVNENTGAYQIGRLLNEVNATLTEQNMTDIVETLKTNGVRPNDAKTIAKALGAVVEGVELTTKQQAVLDGNEIASKVLFDVIINPNSTVNQRMQGYTEAINMVKNGVNPKAETAQNSTVAEQTEIPTGEAKTVEETAKESELSWSPDGKTVLIETDEEVSVKDISSIENGVVTVRLEDGREVNAKDVTFSSQDEALMYEMVADLGVSAETAMSMRDIFNKGNGAVSIQDFRNDAPLAYKYGTIEYAKGLGKLGLTYDQKVDLFALGRKDAKAKREADIAKDKAKVESAKNAQTSEKAKDTTVSKKENVAEKKGRIFNEDGTMADIEELKAHAEKDVQKEGIAVIEFLSTVLSGDYYVYESYLNDDKKRVYKDAKGNEVYAPNGYFRGADGSLHIDLNAGENGIGVMLNTLAHEQGHYIKRVNKAGFKLLSDYIVKYYEETGVDVDALIEERMELMRKRGRLEGLTETQAYDKAFEDVICDGLETIYHDGKVLNMIADLKTTKQGRNVIQQLFDKIKEIINKIVNAYKGVGGVTKAGQEVAKMSLQQMKELQKIFAQALVEADEVYQTLNGDVHLPQEGDIQFSLRVEGENIEGKGEVTKNLVALHNLSETNLLRVIELGGFPMPSIAVTTTELSHENYGDVTVVFGRETIDPESDTRNVVYDRDAWTPTTPTVDVKLSNQGVDSLVKDLQDTVGDYSSYKRNIFSFFDGKYRDNNGDYIVSEYDYTKESFGERAIKNSGIVAAYLGEKGINVEPVYTERGFTMGWASFTRKEATELFDFVGITKDITRDNATQEQRDAILEKYIEYQAKKKLSIIRRFNKNPNLTIEDAIESIRKDYDDGNVSQLFFMAEDFFNENRPKDVYDEYATIDKMQAAITDKQDFYDWFWGKIESVFEKKGIDNDSDVFDRRGNRRSFEQRHFAYTAANIVKAMSKGEQEGKVGFGMTAGALAAKLSKQFDSIEDIHDAKEYLALVSEEDLKAFNDKTYELYDELVTAIAGKSSDFMSDSHRRDDVGDILGKCATAKPLTIENIKRIFDRETKGYNLSYKFNNDIAEQALLLFESLKHIPTTYFEAKPRRVVGFNEIKTVLIPETASQKLKNQLEKSHIKYQVYDNAKETRREIIQDLEDVKFSDRDSDGNELSKEQQEFFKDSKVRDEKGNLLVMYHGSKAKATVFKKEYISSWNMFGKGFYFTSSKKRGQRYAKESLKEVYLDIKNPFLGNKREHLDRLYKEINNTQKDIDEYSEEKGVSGREFFKICNYLDDIGVDVSRILQDLGYDGVYYEGYEDVEVVAYDSNQIKLTTNKTPTSDPDIRYSDRDLAPTFYSQMGKIVDGMKQDKFAADSVISMLRGRGVKAEEIRWSGIATWLEGKKSVTKQELQEFIAGSQLQIGEQMSDASPWDIVKDGDNYIIKDEDGEILETWVYDKGERIWVSDVDETPAPGIASIRNFAKDQYGDGGNRWAEYTLNGGTNYRELVFTMPNSSYSNQMMRTHWGDDAEGVLVHARIQDFVVDGKKMLFIEEIQSDLHNEGRESGYYTDEDIERVDALKAKAHEAFLKVEDYSMELAGSAGEWEFVAKTEEGAKLLAEYHDANEKYKKADNELLSKIPDAPFKETYHEYVLKRLLRMATEQGYDSIGWTPAEIQVKRWSKEFEKAYRIEYDQEMPKFLKKYGRQWGAKVDNTKAPNGEDIWSMDITDSMKDSVLHEGQVLYSDRGVNKYGIEVYETSEKIKNLSLKERQKAFLDVMQNQYRGRTAKFTRNGHTYYASFDYRDINKNIYGDKLSDKKGWKAKINVGAEGEIFELVENAKYNGSKPESGKNAPAHSGVVYWDYFVKNVQIDDIVFDLIANVRKKSDGEFVYSIQLNVNKKIEASPSLGSPNGVLNRMLNASTDETIAQKNRFVNSFSENSENKFSDRDPELAAQREKVNKVLESENAKLKEDNQYLKELVKLQRKVTHGTKFTKSSVQIVASRLMRYASAKGNRAELVNLLNEFYGYIAEGNDLTWESVAEKAQPAIDWLKKNVSRTEKLDAYSREVLNTIRSKRIYLDEQQQAEAAYVYGSFYEYRKKTMGSLTLVSKDNPQGATSLDSQWQEFAEKYPELFDADMNSNEMPMKLLEIVTDIRDFKHQSNEYEYADDMIEQDLLAKVYDGYWDVSTLHTVADSMQKDITKLKIQHHKKMAEVREYHNEKHSQLKQEYQEKIARIREDYRERNAKTTRELMDRYQESRAKAIEGRHKTEYRNKIKKVVGDLNQLLLRPTKDKHVKEELRQAVAEALSAINMDTIGAEERVAKYNELIAKTSDPDMIAELTQTRDRIELQGENLKEKLTALQTAYEKIKKSTDTDLVNAYQEPVMNAIKNVVEMVGNTSIRDMSITQLEAVYEMYSMILHTVRTANKAFKAQKGETITQISEAVNNEIRKNGKEKFARTKLAKVLRKTGWTLLKPLTAFRTMGSETFTGLYKNLRNGEDVFYADVNEAKNFLKEKYEKYNFKSWNQKETKTFKSNTGDEFTINLEQMMSLYAYSRRKQAIDHMMEGGLVLEGNVIVKKNKLGIPIEYEVDTSTAFNISEETLQEICNSLTDEQRAFVEDMQAYLSDVMGAKGNEVSMELLGVKLFKEKFYFPIKSATEYLEIKSETPAQIKLKNSSFSKETVNHANNPIVLNGFTDIWANHIHEMSMYHAFVLPLEDFSRVYNYRTKSAPNVQTMDTKATIKNAYGDGAKNYIENFIKSLNGGVRIDGVDYVDKAISLSKKGAVLASASVAIQQPSAIMRAMALINPIHFVATTHKSINLVKHNRDWAELKTYAPIAGIKEMGGYDIGMGHGTVDWIKDQNTFREKVDDALGKAPAFMDEVTWVSIWNAVKREVASTNKDLKVDSEEFLKVAGERFTEVISLTQVYDSVFSRSDLMRKANPIVKMLTAFMAESSTTLNMLWDAGVQGKRTGSVGGFVKSTAGTTGAVIASVVFNAALKSIITAMRDDDDEETYAEKYIGNFVGDTIDGLNPLMYIPFVKDIVSIFKGYDVGRMDMDLFADLYKAIDALDSESKSEYEKWTGLIGAISAFTGIPYKNVERDIRGAYNTIKSFAEGEKTTKAGIGIAIREGWTGEEISNAQQLYEAYLSDDKEQIKRVEGRFDDKSEMEAALRKALRENDSRINEAAKAVLNGNHKERIRLTKEIVAEGHFKQDIVVAAINAELNYLKQKIKEEEEKKKKKENG